jgi:hypothetical protein
MEKKWMPITAGILDIVAGALSILGIFFAFLGIVILRTVRGGDMFPGVPANLILLASAIIALFFICVDILAIVCGIYTLRRKKWGVALTGSIAAFFASWILGIPAIVFTVISKKDFE